MKNVPEDIKEIINDTYPDIKELNPAQQSVIDSNYLTTESNFIISIPTASGKTLLGVMAALRSILDGGKVVYAAPLISLQNEKLNEFKVFEEFDIKVGKHPNSADLSVMVFESFDAITRYSWDNLREVDTLIIDEFHMIGEYSRGPTLECAITRSKIINPSMRIIALSATLNNINEIKAWLESKVVTHDYRPVPLKKEVLNTEMFSTKNKNDVVKKVVEKAISDSSQVLSFVSTRRFTESLSSFVSDKIAKKIPKDKKETFNEVAEKILDVPKKKGSLPTETCIKLAESVKNGCAFHHAGLFSEQKDIVENEFRNRNILMISATPSLMYGVNLPSKTVVIRDYTRWTSQGSQLIPVFDYLQMSGRAGRPQYDSEGISYIIAKSLDEASDLQERYVNGEVEDTNSKLIENKDAVYKQIIGQIASSLAKTPEDIEDFFKKTFYGYQITNNPSMKLFADESLKYEIENGLNFLITSGFIQPTPEGLKVTKLGNLVAKSNYTIETAVKISQYTNDLVEFNENELLYELSKSPDLPLITFKGRKSKDPVRDKLSSSGIFAVDIGNPEATTVSLIEWIDERNEAEIENAYNVYSASTRRSAYEASLLIKFLNKILEIKNNYHMSKDLDILSARLYYGTKADIIELVLSVKRLGRKRARLVTTAFGKDLNEVSQSQFEKIEGVGSKLAKRLYEYGQNK
ncbi:DEAD/DEAH box helicase [Methanobrevibacter curvatus]|uniref:Ski2-like helicase n=1 Tax=Methanobrevibacter curvatus TaxID=49547 RepID=A0A166C6T0_9EURY|nr:DEAD/DEAH box helicase [Methanobrevibacter curvatus]KZX11737.1 ski2-like helicase [Methanobrevibacter curvatus]